MFNLLNFKISKYSKNSLIQTYFDLFEFQKNQNIQNMFVLAIVFEYFELVEFQKTKSKHSKK